MTDAPRILFAGGCHLHGFPVGAEHSLSRVALRTIGHPCAETPEILAYINLRSGAALAEACRERKTDYLVLQIGHYETMPRFEKILRWQKKPGPGSSRLASSGSGASQTATWNTVPDLQFRPTLRQRLVDARRIVLAQVFRAVGLGRRVFDPAAVANELEALLTALDPMPLKGILLLSPFSCPDSLTRSCRRSVVQIFAQTARRHGCIYLNTFTLLDHCTTPQEYLAQFADPCHLSRWGHARIGQMIGEALRHILETGKARKRTTVGSSITTALH